jgi:hypothetical protein
MTVFPGATASVTLVGVDGRQWDLLDPTSPVSLSKGLGGLHLPHVTQQFIESVGKPGKRWVGSQISARSFNMNILIGDQFPPYRTGDNWRFLDGLFWNGLSTDQMATLIFNGERKLYFRLDEDNEFDFIKDPALHGKAVYPVACIADWPLWQSDELTTTFPWAPDPGTNYYGGATGVGPPFIISPASLFSSAMISNPGDFPAWPTWTLRGQAGTVSVGVGNSIITLPFGLNDGDVVIVNTEEETITDDQGNNLWPLMGFAPIDLAPIPPGDLVPIRIGMENAKAGASITISLTPQYRRAWGFRVGADVVVPPPVGGGDGGGLGTEGLGSGPLGE